MELSIVGYRYFKDYDIFKEKVDEYISIEGVPEKIISGGCIGTDKMAEKYAKEKNIKMIILEPDFAKYKGNKAYFERDKLIAEKCTHLLAFPSKSGKGTQLTIKEAMKLHKYVKIHWIEYLKV